MSISKTINKAIEKIKSKDESYMIRGKKFKVIKRSGDDVTVLDQDGFVTHMHIDFLMENGKKVAD